MAYVARISEGTGRDIVDLVPPAYQQLKWAVIDLDLQVDLPGKDMPKVQEAIYSVRGLVVTWKELLEIADELGPAVTAFCVVGARRLFPIPRNREAPFENGLLTRTADIMIGQHDSGPWTVMAKDRAVTDAVKARFPQAKVAELPAP